MQNTKPLKSMNRRVFLRHAAALGLVAPGLIGVSQKTQAQSPPEIVPGGTLRIQQSVKSLRDPRSYDWSEQGNMTRGFLEYLVQYNADGSFQGMLLDQWQANQDASEYRLDLRQGVTWSDGKAFTADDVVFNLKRWCDKDAPGNSMASRLQGLATPDGQLRDDAVTIENEHRLILRLSAPNIALIADLSDYPAAVMHPDYDGGDPFAFGIGTGPFRPVEMQEGALCMLERDTTRTWWGADIYGGPYLDRIEFVDFGTDPSSWVSAAKSDKVELLYETVGDFIDVLDTYGWTQSRAESAATMVVRANATAEVNGETPYSDAAVRRALALAVDNQTCLELGYAGRGRLGSNDHVSPVHPEFADLDPVGYDPAAAQKAMSEAGLAGFEHRLFTLDDEWQRNTGDAVSAQLKDAGIDVQRQVVSGSVYWQNWQNYPFSATPWNHRPLGVQVLALAYRSDAVWNETGFASTQFDDLLDQAMGLIDPERRRPVMAQLQAILREEGVIIQPYWRALFNHHNGRVVGAEKHPSHELHLYKIGFSN